MVVLIHIEMWVIEQCAIQVLIFRRRQLNNLNNIQIHLWGNIFIHTQLYYTILIRIVVKYTLKTLKTRIAGETHGMELTLTRDGFGTISFKTTSACCCFWNFEEYLQSREDVVVR